MIYIAAQYIYLGNGILKKNQILKFDSKGQLLKSGDFKEEIYSTVFYNGILLPIISKNENIPSIFEKMKEITKRNREIALTGLLDSFALIYELKSGKTCELWCLENPDFSNMRIQENTTFKKVTISPSSKL